MYCISCWKPFFSNQQGKNNFKITLRICVLNKHSKPLYYNVMWKLSLEYISKKK